MQLPGDLEREPSLAAAAWATQSQDPYVGVLQYRTGGSSYADTNSAASLDDIDAVRIVADARKRSESGGQDDVTFGWSVNIALPNVP